MKTSKFKNNALRAVAQRRLKDAVSFRVDISVPAISVSVRRSLQFLCVQTVAFSCLQTADSSFLQTPGGKEACTSPEILPLFRSERQPGFRTWCLPVGSGPRARSQWLLLALLRCVARTDVHRVVHLLAPPYQNKAKNKGVWCRRKHRHWIVKLIITLLGPSFSVISSSGSIHSPFDEFYWVWESQRGQMLCFIMAIHNFILRKITDSCLTFLPFNSCKFFSKQWRKGKKIKPPC